MPVFVIAGLIVAFTYGSYKNIRDNLFGLRLDLPGADELRRSLFARYKQTGNLLTKQELLKYLSAWAGICLIIANRIFLVAVMVYTLAQGYLHRFHVLDLDLLIKAIVACPVLDIFLSKLINLLIYGEERLDG